MSTALLANMILINNTICYDLYSLLRCVFVFEPHTIVCMFIGSCLVGQLISAVKTE